MLASRNRLRRSADFTVAVRRGRRAGGKRLVLHLAVTDGAFPLPPPLVGFVVSKAVGGAVVRNAVARRLRPIVRERLGQFPPGALVVVRALPSAAAAQSTELAADFDAALARVLR